MTALPPNVSVPAVGSVVMVTLAKPLPSTSLKPKSSAVKLYDAPSSSVIVSSVPDGGSLTGTT